MISIIIPVFNQAKKLDNCLKSIKNQIYNNYQIIIVNDGSTDNIGEIVKKHLDYFNFRLKIIDQKNQGSNNARNRGAKSAQGEFLLFCDADIELYPKMLEKMHQALETNHNASYAYCSFFWGNKKFGLNSFDPDKLKQMPYIHTTSLIRREHFPYFDTSIKRFQDWDLWLTMLEQGRSGVWVNEFLFKVATGGTISNWLPSFFYKFFPFLPSVKKYHESVQIIKEKHGI